MRIDLSACVYTLGIDCCFTFTATIRTVRLRAQDGHLDFHIAQYGDTISNYGKGSDAVNPRTETKMSLNTVRDAPNATQGQNKHGILKSRKGRLRRDDRQTRQPDIKQMV